MKPKVRTGIWVFNGIFRLVDSWAEEIGGRRVFKFRLEITSEESPGEGTDAAAVEPTRVIPTSVKLEVWRRDKGRCVECGATDNLHFDHIIPWSRGGSSLTTANVHSCARATTTGVSDTDIGFEELVCHSFGVQA